MKQDICIFDTPSLPTTDHRPCPRPPTYGASTSTGTRGELGINFQREPQEEVPNSLKLEMQADPEPKEKVLPSPKIDLNVSLSPTQDQPEADHVSHEKFKFDLNEAPEEDEANDY